MLDELISRVALEDLAGATAFQRGEEYFSNGAVGPLRNVGEMISATVKGSDTYQVELRDDDGELSYDCTCPRAAEGYFCKHCVALGLAWLARISSAATAGEPSGKGKQRDPWAEIERYLHTQAAESLIEMLLDVAQRDEHLFHSLLLKAGRTGPGADVEEAFRRAIDAATSVDDFVDWREVGAFTGNLDQVVDSMAELLQPETAATLIELAEYAIERLEDAMEQVDDSSGEVGGIAECLGELHLQACALARPEPENLAERLFWRETNSSYGLCKFDALTYREVLGEAGLRRYRELAETEWRKLKPRDAKDDYDAHRATITAVMERLAEASGDVDQWVAIKARDLSSAYRYLGIAEILAQASRPDEALEWAERGLKAFPEHPDNRLRDFLVGAYLARQRHDEALQLTWIQFTEKPILEYYKKLHAVADPLGVFGLSSASAPWRCWPTPSPARLTQRLPGKPGLRPRITPKGLKSLCGKTIWRRLGQPRRPAFAIAVCLLRWPGGWRVHAPLTPSTFIGRLCHPLSSRPTTRLMTKRSN